jgi:hypothetical protein
MKTNQANKRIMGGARSAGKPVSVKANMPIFQEVSRGNLIQWPSEQEIEEVSKRLAKISRAGIRWEANGDYFNSGDLAYQVQEIIRSTAELFKKSQRLKT